MNDRSTFRLSAHQLAWSAVNGLLWMPGLAFAVMGFLQWFGPRGATTTNPNLAFLLSGLAVFALLFARNEKIKDLEARRERPAAIPFRSRDALIWATIGGARRECVWALHVGHSTSRSK